MNVKELAGKIARALFETYDVGSGFCGRHDYDAADVAKVIEDVLAAHFVDCP